MTQFLKAAQLFDLDVPPPRRYWDKANYPSLDDQLHAMEISTTVYLGNLSFYTSEQHIYELARQAGPIKKVIMGLHREEKTPCGFAFVEYFNRSSCKDAELLLTGKVLEGRVVKFELDPGFKEGRQFGRGRGGGQVRDDFREEYDGDRGGVGAFLKTTTGEETSQPTEVTTVPPPPFSSIMEQRSGEYRTNSHDDGGGKRQRHRSQDNRRTNQNSRNYRSNTSSSQSRNPGTRQVDEFGRDIVHDSRNQQREEYD